MKKNSSLKIFDFVLNDNFSESLIENLAKHPYIYALLACLLIHPFFSGSINYVPGVSIYFFNFVLTALLVFIEIKAKRKDIISSKVLYALVPVTIIALTFFTYLYFKNDYPVFFHFWGGIIVCILFYLLLYTDKYASQLKGLLIISLGGLVKFIYVLGSSIYNRQHDVGAFGQETAHAGYIEFILFNHKLPDFDVSTVWQYAHPPLHHIISACWIGLNEYVFHFSSDQAREGLQTLTLFYTICIMITFYKILKHFKIKGKAFFAALIIICFHPTFTLFAGYINNDTITAMLVILAFYAALKWMESPTLKNIIKLALFIGFAMMGKLSAGTIAPAVALIFLIFFIKSFKNKDSAIKPIDYIKQFVIFGVICIPIALWYEIRNHIKWGLPINFVYPMDPAQTQYLGNEKFSKFAFDFGLYQFKNVYEQRGYYDDAGTWCNYNEHNPLIAILKNSLFGEGIKEYTFPNHNFYNKIAFLLFWVAFIIAIFAFVAMIINTLGKVVKHQKDNLILEKILIITYYFTMIISLYSLVKSSPYTCSMNFRYISPTVIMGALSIGLFFNNVSSDNETSDSDALTKKATTGSKASSGDDATGSKSALKNNLKNVIYMLSITFAILSAWLYLGVSCSFK
ncbi:MAG: glycosyltransferase family 39 protein [Lachnospiraceae bacterium]|nr:glycosyltransferase family 39 protein [Lachnospiraceae bacterium]